MLPWSHWRLKTSSDLHCRFDTPHTMPFPLVIKIGIAFKDERDGNAPHPHCSGSG
jgi:hypothetical protein